MKPEMLDALLLDRALGELTPEVAALLDAHLTRDPTARQRATEFSASVMLARAAVATPREPPRPLDVARLQRERRAVVSTMRAAQLLRLAACLALGLALGWLAHPASKPAAPLVASALPTVTRPSEPATDFWSIAHFAPESTRTHLSKKP